MSEVRNCFVTGASGFIGHALCRYLGNRGCNVRALTRGQLEGPWDDAIIANIGVDRIPQDYLNNIDTVFHLAGVVHAMRSDQCSDDIYQAVNVRGSEELALAAVEAGAQQFVYFSTVKAVADPDEQCVDESWDALPQDPYGVSKREAEKRLLEIGKQYSMHVTVLRPALVYGPGVKGNLQRMLSAVDIGRFPPLPDTGNKRSMVHLNDLLEAAWLAVTSPEANGEIYIVSDSQAYSTRQMYEWMCEALGKRNSNWAVPLPALQATGLFGDILEKWLHLHVPLNSEVLQRLTGSACYRSGKIQQELGWQPRRHFREALAEMVAAYRAS